MSWGLESFELKQAVERNDSTGIRLFRKQNRSANRVLSILTDISDLIEIPGVRPVEHRLQL